MYPFIEIFGLSIPMYGVLSVIGLFLAGDVALLLSRRRGVDIYILILTAMLSGAGVLIGAHLLYAITRIGDISAAFAAYSQYDSLWDFMKYLLNLSSGMVFYGGLYGGLLAGFIWVRHKGYPRADMCDVFAVTIPFFHMFGRVGCFFAGCCYGIECDHGFSGRVLSDGSKESVVRLPVQLIEAGILFLLFAVLLVLFLTNRAKGRLLSIYLLSYGVIRFMTEFFRGDEIRGRFLLFTTSQWISLLAILAVTLYLCITLVRRKLKA